MKDLMQTEETLQKQITDLKLEIEKLKTHINSLRGLINRKLQVPPYNPEGVMEKEKFKYDDGLDSFRFKEPNGP